MLGRYTGITLSLFLAVAASAVDPHHSISSKVAARKKPIWIPAAEAADAKGAEKATRAEGHPGWDDVRQMANASAAGTQQTQPCIGVTQFDERSPRDFVPPSLDALAKRSKVVAVGVVREAIPGFYDGFPATVIAAKVIDRVRYGADEVLFVYPAAATFSTGGRTFCRTNLKYGNPPAVGDKVLLFGNSAADPEGTLFVPNPWEILIQHGPHFELPADLTDDPALRGATTFADVVSRTHERASEAKQ
jgi:hypothetical protein